MKYLLSPYKKIYHKAQYNEFSSSWQSKCHSLPRQSENRVVLAVPKNYRPCERCYKDEVTTLIYQEDFSI